MEEVVPCGDLRCIKALIDEGKLKFLNFSQKKELVTSPRPTPDLSICRISRTHKRYFARSVYKTEWIAGCSHTNRLYCWCCIFFSTDSNVWNTTGYDDLNNLTGATRRHMKAQKHMIAVISFSKFAKAKIDTTLSRQLCVEISRNNTRVDYNRRVFQRLVDIVCHLAQQELASRSHGELKTTLNRANFLALVSLLSKYGGILEEHGQESGKSSEPSYLCDKIHNDVMHSVADVMQAHIEYEAKQAPFVSIIIDETPDVSRRKELYLILRYYSGHEIEDRFLRYYSGHEIEDRFLGYVNVSEGCAADILPERILELLKKLNCNSKLVAQSYDSANMISGVKNYVLQKVQAVCPQAMYIWCNAQTLNCVLFKSCNRIAEVRTFFSGLQSLCAFFSRNRKRAAFYDLHCSVKLPHSDANYWLYMSELVNTVFEQKINLVAMFSEVCANPQNWDGATIAAAENFGKMLRSFNMNFFLTIFHQFFQKADGLFGIVQELQEGVDYCSNKIKDFQTWLRSELLSGFNEIYDDTLNNSDAPRLKRNIHCASTEFMEIFIQVLDNIDSEITDLFSEIAKLKFFQLLDCTKFKSYMVDFPTEQLDSLTKNYLNYFEKQTLRNELKSLYSFTELKYGNNVFDLIDYINASNLEGSFPQVLKLAKLVVTIPATSASAERAFSSLRSIHTYMTNTQGNERISELAMITIEKQLLKDLKSSPKFYTDVINEFVKRNTHFDLQYK